MTEVYSSLYFKLLKISFFILFFSGLINPVFSDTEIQLKWDESTGSVIVSWSPNSESDLAGYKIYYGVGSFTKVIDAGNTTSYSIGDLKAGETYQFAVTAYDDSKNESDFSNTVLFEVKDTEGPEIVSVFCIKSDLVEVTFNEKLDTVSANIETNYAINNGIVVQSAILQSDHKTVQLKTLEHGIGDYTLTVTDVKDASAFSNTINTDNNQMNYTWEGEDVIAPSLKEHEIISEDYITLKFSEPMADSTIFNKLNYQFNPSLDVYDITRNDSCNLISLNTHPHTLGENYILTINNLRDIAGNIMNSTSIEYQMTSGDTTAPRLIAARIQESRKELILDFSEALEQISAENIENYVISPSISISSATLNTSKQSVTLTTSEHSSGKYTITAYSISDIAVPANVMISDQCSYEVNFDTTRPSLDSLMVKSKELLELRFSERLDGTSAQDKGNYIINPPLNIYEATLDVTQQNVLLQTQSHSSGSYQLSLSGVMDIASNTINPAIIEYSYEEPDRSPPQLNEVILHGLDMLELIFNEPLERITAEDVSNYSINNIVVEGVSLTGDSLNHVYLSTSDHIPGENYTVTINNINDDSPSHNTIEANTQMNYNCPLLDQIPPRLISVELQGFNFLILKFSEILDSSSVQDTSLFTISPPLNITEVSLDMYGKIIYLKTENHQIGVDYTITVEGVTDKAGNVIGIDNQQQYSCVSTDNQPPVLLRAEALSDATVELKFNEALDLSPAMNASNYSIDNDISIKRVRVDNSQQYVYLTTSPHQNGSYTITVRDLLDLAGNRMQSSNQMSYQYTPEDNTPPRISGVEVTNEKTVEIVFSEPVDPESAENINNYTIDNSISILSAKLDVRMTSVILQTTKHERGDYVLSVKNITDVHNNVIESNTIENYTYAPEDNEAPYIVSANLENDHKLIILFNEDLDLATALNDSNYAINKNISIKSVLSYISKKVVLETSDHSPGTYTLTVNGIRDASENKNYILPYSQKEYVWSPIDTTAPSLVSVNLNNQYSLALKFSESLSEEEATNVSNYTITPPVNIEQALLSSTFDIVHLVTGKHETGTYTIKVDNIYDQAFNPNKISKNNSKIYAYNPPDTAAPQLSALKLNTSQLVSLTFNESVTRKSAENISNYYITPDIDITSAYLLSSFREVHLETSAHQVGQQYLIEIRGLEDRSPSSNKLSQPIQHSYSFSPPDIEPPELSLAKLREINRLELVFNEPVEKKSGENRENYKIKAMNQDYYIEIFDANLDTSTFKKVYLQTSDHMPGLEYSVCAENIKDRASPPNTIDSGIWINYTMGTSNSTQPNTNPEVARLDVISPQKMRVLFTKTINQETAEDYTNYTINSDITVKSAELDTTGLRVELETTEHSIGSPYSVCISNIYDATPEHNELITKEPVKYIIGHNGVSINSINQHDYQLNIADIGENVYIDRSYTIEQMPQCLQGAIQIITRNNDKQETGSSFLNFEIRGDATVYLAYDKRISQKPEWLKEWEITGDQIMNSRNDLYQIYSREVSTKRFAVGGNAGSMDDNMYLVFIKPHFARKRVLHSLNRSSYSINYVTVGDRCYIDRDYTLAYIPDSLKNLLWIQTANDDKQEREEDFLQFSLKCSSNVYIGFDANNPSLPRWLNNSTWSRYEGQITDSRGAQFDIYFNRVDSGKVVIGGNCGGPDDNMYFVIIKPLEDIGNTEDSRVPGYFTLRQNYPNPFNPSTEIPITKIEYTIEKGNKQKDNVTLKIYNILGQLVKDFNLSARDMTVGNHSVTWDGTDINGIPVASGVYFYTIQQGHYATTEKMLLLR